MGFEYWHEGLLFIGLFLVMVGVPCFFTAILGVRLIEDLGQWPSKSARLQMGVCVQILCVEIAAFLMLAGFFKFFSQ
jgi:hypothetical protein